MSGWISMHRGWRDNEAFEEPRDPMSDADAWFWLIEHTAWKRTARRGGQGQVVALRRGQIHVSDRSLAAAFRWDKKRVRRYLDRLQSHSMVDQEKDQSGTTITICNYDKFQRLGAVAGPVTGSVEDQSGTSLSDGDIKGNPAEQVNGGTTHRTINNSASNEAGVPPVDTVKAIFEIGVTLLTASGQDDRASRSIVGRWRKEFGDARVLEALIDCRARSISNPVEWMPRRLAAAGPANATDTLREQTQRYAALRNVA